MTYAENDVAKLLYLIPVINDTEDDCTAELLNDVVYILQSVTEIEMGFHFNTATVPDSPSLKTHLCLMQERGWVECRPGIHVCRTRFIRTVTGEQYQDRYLKMPSITELQVRFTVQLIMRNSHKVIKQIAKAFSIINETDGNIDIWEKSESLWDTLWHVPCVPPDIVPLLIPALCRAHKTSSKISAKKPKTPLCSKCGNRIQN